MESSHENKDTVKNKPAEVETVDKLISEKNTEKKQEARAKVRQSAEGVQTEVADVMSGVETSKEVVSEVKSETGERGDITTGGQQNDDSTQQIHSTIAVRPLPSQEIMVRKIRTAINAQIKMELRKAAKLKKTITTGGAQEYNSHIAKIRRLKETLKTMLTSTFEIIKVTYLKYFTEDGRRKNPDEV